MNGEKGAKAAIPIMIGMPIGFSFRYPCISKDLQLNIFMSLFVYAGSAQFIAAAMMFSGSRGNFHYYYNISC